ncbi:MAG TPA: Sua5/YciO/YrdC/YwlC family protein, partial [Polyangiaceae bacterium]|nr:Sua5/YciO/YrdC/YwlC family protein [Polyangiaceae bacterium]
FAAALWPGQLSIALPASSAVIARVALDGSLAVRLPGGCAAAELCTRFGRPLSATSANLPGAPPATSSAHVAEAFRAAVEHGQLYVLTGASPGGAPSTVVTVTGQSYAAARVGAVPLSALDAIANGRTRDA